MLSQLKQIYTSQPPDPARWAGTTSGAADLDQPVALVEAETLVLDVGARVEALFEDSGAKKWFGGVVVALNANDCSYHVKFDDGEEGDFTGNKHSSLAF